MSPYGLDLESRNNHRPAPNPRHSGLDPESNPFPVMDPGSMSPRELGDVRDDVCSALPTNVLHVISGLTRNPVLISLWIPDQCHLAASVTSGMTYVRLSQPMSCTSFRACPGIQKQPSPSPKPTSFRARPGIQSIPDPFLYSAFFGDECPICYLQYGGSICPVPLFRMPSRNSS